MASDSRVPMPKTNRVNAKKKSPVKNAKTTRNEAYTKPMSVR